MIPYPGHAIKRGDKGRTVTAISLLMRDANIRKQPAIDTFTERLAANVKTFQRRHHLRQTGVVNRATWINLQWLFSRNAYARWLVKHTPKPVPLPSKRDLIVKSAWYGYHNRASVHYSQRRPFASHWYLPMYIDCSGFATLCYHVARAPDPNGLGYSGAGFTGTLMAHGSWTSSPVKGDLVFYSYPDHVAVYVGGGKVISHGSESAPYYLDMHYRPVRQVRSYI